MLTVVGSLDALSTMELNNTTSNLPDQGDARICAIRSGAPMPPDPDVSMALRLLDILNTFYMPVVIYLGLVGNLLSLVTFFFTHLKSRTSSLYMGSLAISDAGFLFVLSFAWLQEQGVNVNGQGWCPILVFLSSAFSCCSVWLTVGFTAERFMAVRYPMWRFQLGTTKLRPKTAIIATAVCSFAFNAHLLIFVSGRQEQGGFEECRLNPHYEDVEVEVRLRDEQSCTDGVKNWSPAHVRNSEAHRISNLDFASATMKKLCLEAMAHSWARGGASASAAAMTSLLWNAQTGEARAVAAQCAVALARQLCAV
ncbi:hypothetical protein HPB47_027829 [Ixodes persulcatus]|uniref:Uncharacterized protein n=1 Tax=Ixodes persulcatus TaxID=34615 RepID=A0AC60PV25_IXOPE|nr:hypothetical protein HPB47_027829 [Ixodes persulcatus]